MYLGVTVEAFCPAGRALRHCANAPAASFVTHCVRSSVQWPFAASATAPSARWLHALTRFTKKKKPATTQKNTDETHLISQLRPCLKDFKVYYKLLISNINRSYAESIITWCIVNRIRIPSVGF